MMCRVSSNEDSMETTIDEALEILENTGPEFGVGFSNHGPMGSEAMITLGRPEGVVSWAESYRKRLREHPQPRDPISAENWQEALGKFDRCGDWDVFFQNQLKENSWQFVIRKWAPMLAPGMMAGGTHGIIRTGHAVRTLTHGENQLRLNELAEGLAYWASSFHHLPGERQPNAGKMRPKAAIKTVPIVPREELGKYKLIEESMQALEFVDFKPVVNSIDVTGDANRFLSELTEMTAGCYLANASHIGHAITFIHTVTAPSMLRLLLPYIDSNDYDSVLSYAWQTAMGLYSVSGQDGRFTGCDHVEDTHEELVDRAIHTKDEHAMKFAEACLREFSLNPKPIYLAATSHASRLIGKEPVTPAVARC